VVLAAVRPAVFLLELVREGKFNGESRRHRRKLLTDDSLLEFVAASEDAPATLVELAEIQMRYRRERGTWAPEAARLRYARPLRRSRCC
jgi:hypothetical protein